MATHVALLRGINLGGRNKVAMTDLRALVAELGHAEVSTYIQSGNVLFSPGPGAGDAEAAALAGAMAEAITAKLGVSAPVVVAPATSWRWSSRPTRSLTAGPPAGARRGAERAARG